MRRRLLARVLLPVVALALGVSSWVVYHRGEQMPDLSKAVELRRHFILGCARPIGRIDYDTDGNPHNGEELAGFYFLDSDKKAPFAVVVFDGQEVKIILVDLDYDGRVDVKGRPGDPGIGHNVCEVANRVKSSASPQVHRATL